MKELLRSLPRQWEFLLVLLAAFGLPIYASVIHALSMSSTGRRGGAPISNGSLLLLGIEETVILLLLVSFLRVRGWSRQQIGLEITWLQTLGGLGLALAAQAAYVGAFYLTYAIAPQVAESASRIILVQGPINTSLMLAISVLNSIYEELFLCGYVITALKDRGGGWAGIHVSVAIRMLCHLYQGTVGVMSILPMGFLFGVVYVRTGKLWPLIAAHITLDVWAFLSYS